MADPVAKPKQSWLRRLAAAVGFKSDGMDEIDKADALYGTQAMNGGYGQTALQGVDQRTRGVIYAKWQSMLHDPVVSSAMHLHVTAALGGDQTSGNVVFIERTTDADKDKSLVKLIDEVSAELLPLMNRIAYTVAYNAASFGDAYGRVYTKPGVGVTDVYVDEMVMPPLVQPYERAGKTIGYVVYVGEKQRTKLSAAQMIRMRLPRMNYIAQPLAVQKARLAVLEEDDSDKLPVMPAIAGGSFLASAEEAYDRYLASLLSLIGTRAKGSLDVEWLKLNISGMTRENQQVFLDSVANAQKYYRAMVDSAVKTKNPVLAPVRFLLPVSDDKQLATLDAVSSKDTSAGYTIDDVMMQARMLAGSMGIDLSMLGFADQMAGGLGDGGFFRTSAQAAERSRFIRVGIVEFFDALIELHLLFSRKLVFDPKERPWKVNLWGTISSLQSEQQKTEQDEMSAASTLIDTMIRLKEIGFDAPTLKFIFAKKMGFTDEDATMLSNALFKAKPQDDGAGGGFGGGADLAPNPDRELEDA